MACASILKPIPNNGGDDIAPITVPVRTMLDHGLGDKINEFFGYFAVTGHD